MPRTTREARVDALSETPSDHMFLERAELTDARLAVQGWFFNDAEELSGAEMVIHTPGASRKVAVQTQLVRRDVAEKFTTPRALRSGFSTILDFSFGKELLSRVELHFRLGSGRTATYEVHPVATSVSAFGIIVHSLKNLNLADLKWAALQLGRGRILRLWDAMRSSAVENGEDKPPDASLRTALGLLKSSGEADLRLTAAVDIVIPVYNGFDYLDALFESLARNTDPRHRIILVDDCSPDPRVRERLGSFVRQRDNVVLELLTENLGFVGAVNRGASLSDRDFVILNTDVVVPPLWIERLFHPIEHDDGVASVTPFSNAATICSFPEICQDNVVFNSLDVSQIDRWFQLVDPASVKTALPTAVGFCMAIRRSVWNQIGPFDQAAFGKGYGEENDWSQRAIARGFRNVVCPNLYVYHRHGGSFEPDTRQELRDRGLAEVVRRHPNYPRDVDDYIAADILRPLRKLLNLLVRWNAAQTDGHLVIDHGWGGGANAYRERMVAEWVDAGCWVMLVTIVPPDRRDEYPAHYRLQLLGKGNSESYDFSDWDCLARLIDLLPVKHIFLNSAVGDDDPEKLLALVAGLTRKSGARLTIPVHDYFAICPSYTLIDSSSRYCGVPDVSTCSACLPHNTHAYNPTRTTITRWRACWSELLGLADRILCFSQSSRTLMLKVFPDAASRIVVQPHELAVSFTPVSHSPSARFRIGVVGSIGFQKGSEVLLRLARVMAERDRTARLVIIGTTDIDKLPGNMSVTGTYEPVALPALIAREQLDFFFLPSIWPETFSYVTQELMEMGVAVTAFDVGAPAERLRNYSRGHVIDLARAYEPEKLYAELRAIWSTEQDKPAGSHGT